MREESDEDLVEWYRAAGGSPKGDVYLNQLFQRHHSKVAGWCLRMTGDVDSAVDLAQDVFIKAFQGIDGFRGGAKFTTWVYTITRNRCMDELRLRASRGEQAEEGVIDQLADGRVELVSSAMEKRESEQLLRRLMAESLDDIEIQIMTMHYFDEMPLDAIGRVLQLSNASGAKAFIVSAKRKLGRAMERWKNAEQNRKGDAHVE